MSNDLFNKLPFNVISTKIKNGIPVNNLIMCSYPPLQSSIRESNDLMTILINNIYIPCLPFINDLIIVFKDKLNKLDFNIQSLFEFKFELNKHFIYYF